TDTLPSGLGYVSATPQQGTCQQASGTVTCSLGAIATGASTTIQLVTSTSATGQFANTASVSANEPDLNPADNTVSKTVTVAAAGAADLAVTEAGPPAGVVVGTHGTITATVTDNGPAAATGVTFTDTLPANLVFFSATPSQGTCGQAAGVVTCVLGDLAGGASATV